MDKEISYYIRTASLVGVFTFDLSKGKNYGICNSTDTFELKKTPTHIDDFKKQFDWVKECCKYDNLVFAALGTDGSLKQFNNHKFTSGYVDSVYPDIVDWKYDLFIYELYGYTLTQLFLRKHSKTKIRTIDSTEILIKYTEHYYKLFEKQYNDGMYLTGDNVRTVYPVTTYSGSIYPGKFVYVGDMRDAY